MAREQLFELGRRSFDTPQFRGIEFIEVEAKTILNHVPGNYLPFNWTINPYRGCSHACTYCMAGDTPILMADGRTKPLSDLAVGDSIYGTVSRGSYRRYVTTEVLAHWSTVKPAYRITLEDGTELIASGDHRFLSDRGWKHVTATGNGILGRPALAPGDRLVGPGIAKRPPVLVAAGGRQGADSLREGITEVRVVTGATVTSSPGLDVVSIDALGVELPLFDITTGTGDFIANGVVSHNCFARSTHTYMDMNAGRDFETKIVVKVNAGELLGRQLRAKRWKGESIAMGTATDPYQRAEGRYKLMPKIIETLTEFRNPFSILTKGTLILRDLDLLVEAGAHTDVSTAFSIGTLDEDAWRTSEPGTPHPRKRIEAVAKLNDAGIPCGVLVAPILPGITDHPEQLRAVVTAALDAGATHVSPILLHLRPKVKEVFMDWLGSTHPDLVERYNSMYARSAYAAKGERDALSATFGDIVAATGRPPRPRPSRRRSANARKAVAEPPKSEQMSLL